MAASRTTLTWGWLALLTGAIVVYLFGLGSFYAPTNGDEMVYIHIARRTAETGHWLPLASDLANMRNTKPPLLIWQAMVAGGWGQSWNLWALRLPSIVYTALTSGMVALLAFHFSARSRTACLAALVYLAFFSTFRYGRVYLTSAPETFWLALPLVWLLLVHVPGAVKLGAARHAAAEPAKDVAFGFYLACGLAMGLGAAYKSFALVAPAAATLGCALLLLRPSLQWRSVWQTGGGLAVSSALALGIFALWFVLDPDPAAVWREFVVGENAGKMASAHGYWHDAVAGDYPVWQQWLAYFENAGLLWFVTMGLAFAGLLQLARGGWQRAPLHTRILVVWLLVWLLVFSVPSQRSARYVIPAMPALAILAALYWERIARGWFVATLLLSAPALIMLARITWVLGGMDIGTTPLLLGGLAMTALGVCAVAAGLVRPHWTRNATLLACLALYGSFSWMVAPLATAQANYSAAVQQRLQGARVAVPNGFNAQYERFRFALPQSRVTPYDTDGRNAGELYPEMAPDARLKRLLQEFDAVVWVQDDRNQAAPSCAPQCQVIAQRWHVKSRHKSGEITLANLWTPQEWLFRREWLIVPAP